MLSRKGPALVLVLAGAAAASDMFGSDELLLTEVAITGPTQALPKLAVLISSAAAAVIAAVAMKLLPEVGAADDAAAAAPAA